MAAPDLQKAFFTRMAHPQDLRRLFEHLDGVFFFLKDDQSRMVSASRPILRRFGLSSESEIVGSTDYDFFPSEIADNFVRDDRRVTQTGQPMINRVEVWYNEQRVLDWFVTTKLPVFGREGSIIGVMGTTQSYEGKRREMAPFARVSRAVEYVRRNLDRNVGAEELAREAGLSPRQLSRKFRDAFGMTPHEFALKTRIQAASEALARTDDPIIQIALDFGFCDQSAFTVQFRKHTGITPKEFRRRYSGG